MSFIEFHDCTNLWNSINQFLYSINDSWNSINTIYSWHSINDLRNSMNHLWNSINDTNARGGNTQVQRGAAPALRISRKKGSFLRPPYVRDFVKEGYFFVPRYEVWGLKSPIIHKIYAALTLCDSRSDWASKFAAAAKHAEDYKI